MQGLWVGIITSSAAAAAAVVVVASNTCYRGISNTGGNSNN